MIKFTNESHQLLHGSLSKIFLQIIAFKV